MDIFLSTSILLFPCHRHAVGKQSAATSVELKPSAFDPKEKVWTRFPPEGSKQTPPHQSIEFRWKDYCPMVFRLAKSCSCIKMFCENFFCIECAVLQKTMKKNYICKKLNDGESRILPLIEFFFSQKLIDEIDNKNRRKLKTEGYSKRKLKIENRRKLVD
jgi:hypothetical protein